MPALNEQVLPSAWSIIRRSLADAAGISRQALVNRLTPTGLIRRAGATESRHVRPSLVALIEIGAVIEDDSAGLRLADGLLSEDAFRLFVTRRFLVAPPRGGDLWQRREGSRQLEHHAQIAVAWLHLQGLETPVVTFAGADELLTAQLGSDRELLRDTAPYNTLERLSRWCGIAASMTSPRSGGGMALVPDPTAIVRVALDEVLPAAKEERAQDVIRRLAEVFPWLPNGDIGRAVADALRDIPDDSAERGACPQGLSLALLQLEMEELVELVAGDDASDRISLSLVGGDSRPVARIRRR